MEWLRLHILVALGLVLVFIRVGYGTVVPDQATLDDSGMASEDYQLMIQFHEKYDKELKTTSTLSRCRRADKVCRPGSYCLPIPWGDMWMDWFKSFINMNPASSDKINTKFFFSSRTKKDVQIETGKINLATIDFDPKKKTVMIVHGYMSHGNVNWIQNMRDAYLIMEDVNVIVVDWHEGANTLKYWRSAVNTQTVSEDIVNLIKDLQKKMKIDVKKFHLIGHSLGAHTMAFTSQKLAKISTLGKVSRITGLDPALPCFNVSNLDDKLDSSDADFVDIIHTNGKQVAIVGFGVPNHIGHVDFYVNGGLRQPGCQSAWKVVNMFKEAVCSHGRSYEYFTESLSANTCEFVGFPWDLTVAGAKKIADMSKGKQDFKSLQKMGIKASRDVKGNFFVITKPESPYCTTDLQKYIPEADLLEDIHQTIEG